MGTTKSKKAEAAGADESPDKTVSPEPGNELHARIWSVVSFEGVIENSLTYDEAAELRASLEQKKTPGLCIVTNAAAERIG